MAGHRRRPADHLASVEGIIDGAGGRLGKPLAATGLSPDRQPGYSVPTRSSDSQDERTKIMDFKLELAGVPVSDVDRAKTFYTERAGFNADHDHRVSEDIRFVQLTPSGSACSIALGTGISDMEPGSLQGLQLVVSDIEAAREQLVQGGVDVSEIQEFPWGSFVFFSDPDGNGWAVQGLPARDGERS